MKRPWPIWILIILFGLGALEGISRLGRPGLPAALPFQYGIAAATFTVCGSIAYGLWKLRNWARLAAVIFCSLFGAAIVVIVCEFRNSEYWPIEPAAALLAIDGIIVWYLLKNSTKTLFEPRR